VVPIHDALLSELGETISNNWVMKACDDMGAKFAYLKPGDNIELG
jgi:hypothetical protein